MATALKSFTSGEYHYVFGEVYAPDRVDTDGEAMTSEDIRKMAHDFIAGGRVRSLDTNHDHIWNGAEVVESFIARKGDPDFSEGSWVLGVRMPDGPLWEAIKSGEINSYSFEASVLKEPSKRLLPEYPSFFIGSTLKSEDHTHAMYLELDNRGSVILGKTDTVNGHSHEIHGLVVTEMSAGHRHRFSLEL